MMANIRVWLEEAEKQFGEPIEAMVVGKHCDRAFDEHAMPDENVILSRAAGLAKVDEEYYDGFGGRRLLSMLCVDGLKSVSNPRI